MQKIRKPTWVAKKDPRQDSREMKSQKLLARLARTVKWVRHSNPGEPTLTHS